MLENKYREEIQKIDAMINHWDELAESEVEHCKAGIFDVRVDAGLCYNALTTVKAYTIHEIFKTWPRYSGNVLYPIEGSSHGFHSTANKFSDDRRLSLAKHIRTELFILGTPKPTITDKVQTALDNNILLTIALVALFFTFGYLFAINI